MVNEVEITDTDIHVQEIIEDLINKEHVIIIIMIIDRITDRIDRDMIVIHRRELHHRVCLIVFCEDVYC